MKVITANSKYAAINKNMLHHPFQTRVLVGQIGHRDVIVSILRISARLERLNEAVTKTDRLN